MNGDERDRLAAAYFAGELKSAEQAALLAQLRADPNLARELAQLQQTERLMKLEAVGSTDEQFTREVLERLKHDAPQQEFTQKVVTRARRMTPPREGTRRATSWWIPAVAAAVALAAIAGIVWHRAEAPASRIVRQPQPAAPKLLAVVSAGTGTLARGSQTLPAVLNVALQQDDALSSNGGPLSIKYDDGSTVELNAATRTTLLGDKSAKRLKLERGDIFVRASKQAQPWVLETPTAEATIVGTALELSVSAQGTTVRVAEGEVRFSSQRKHVSVTAGKVSVAQVGAAPSAPTASDAKEFAAWRLPRSPNLNLLPDWASAENWELTARHLQYHLEADKLSVQPGEHNSGVVRLIAKSGFEFKDNEVVRLRLKVAARTKAVHAAVMLLDADDERHGAKPHLHLGFNTVFSDVMLAVRTYPDAPENQNEKGMADRLHHARNWSQPRPAKPSSIELVVSRTSVTLRLDGRDCGTYEHNLTHKRWRLELNCSLPPQASAESLLELSALTLEREQKK